MARRHVQPTRWRDDTGRSRWQPTLGQHLLHRDPWRGHLPIWTASPGHDFPAVLHRWRWTAVLRARLEQRRRAREFTPARSTDG